MHYDDFAQFYCAINKLTIQCKGNEKDYLYKSEIMYMYLLNSVCDLFLLSFNDSPNELKMNIEHTTAIVQRSIRSDRHVWYG